MVNVSDLIGIPYKVHGRDESGLDCFGLIWLISKRAGHPIHDPEYKGFKCTLVKLADYVGVKKLEKFEVGCILEIEKDARLHLGYAINEKEMLHTTMEGVIVEDISKYLVKGYYTWA